MTLHELRDALRKATGPDSALDAELWFFFAIETIPYPKFTGSIDAAVTLVPDEYRNHWKVGIEDEDGPVARLGSRFAVAAATPTLALCLARLEYEIARKEGA